MTRRRKAALVHGLFLSVAGAWLTLFCLDYTLDPAVPMVRHLSGIMLVVLCMVRLADLWLHRRFAAGRSPSRGSPAWSGGGALLSTAAASLLFFDRDVHQRSDLLIPLFTVLLCGAGAIALIRFALRHADEIGEARFDTSGRDGASG